MSRRTVLEKNNELYACKLSNEDIRGEIIELLKYWDTFLLQVSCKTNNWKADYSIHSLADIIIRVDKRKTYYEYFHNMNISLRKRAGLFAYWIVKLRPFAIAFEDNVEPPPSDTEREMAAEINEHFAAFYIYACLSLESKTFKDYRRGMSQKSKGSYHEALVYTLRYRNVSIDSMMLLMETLVPSSLDREISRR